MTTPTGHGFRFEPGSEGVQIDAPLLDISLYVYAQEVADLAADLFHAQTQVSLGSKQQYQHNGVHLFTDKALSERDASVDVRVRRSTMADVRADLYGAVMNGTLDRDPVNEVLLALNMKPLCLYKATVYHRGEALFTIHDLEGWDRDEVEDHVLDTLRIEGSIIVTYTPRSLVHEIEVDGDRVWHDIAVKAEEQQ